VRNANKYLKKEMFVLRTVSPSVNLWTLPLTIVLVILSDPKACKAHTNCEIYARYTALQFKTNDSSNCGFSGGFWEGSIKEHIDWCKDAGFDEVRQNLMT
jgi:hypothetical protein